MTDGNFHRFAKVTDSPFAQPVSLCKETVKESIVKFTGSKIKDIPIKHIFKSKSREILCVRDIQFAYGQSFRILQKHGIVRTFALVCVKVYSDWTIANEVWPTEILRD